MKKYEHQRLEEVYYKEILPNGLTVYLYPKCEFSQTLGMLITKYGSDDICFIPRGETKFYHSPQGVAHFLEHKLFDYDDKMDVSDLFTKLGASCNAYTSNDQTVFYFTTSQNEMACVETLLNFMQKPRYREEDVEKEKSIIIQEIKMHQNNPGTILDKGLMENMFFNLPCKFDIGGTEASVKATTKADLDKCFYTFYHPSNMALIIVGRFDLDKMIEIIKNKNKEEEQGKILRKKYLEPDHIVNQDTTSKFDVETPIIGAGIKIPIHNLTKHEKYHLALYLDFYFDYYFENTSDFVINLKKDQIICSNLTCTQDEVDDFMYISFITSVKEDNLEKYKTLLKEKIQKINEEKIPEIDFIRMKKGLIATNIAKYNSLNYILETIANLYMHEIEIFEGSNLKEKVDYQDFLKIRKYFNLKQLVFHTILK